MPEAKPDICVLASFSGEGGVERMLLNLVDAFARHHYRIDLLLIKSSSRHLVDVPPSVETQELGSRHTATSLLPLVRYLRRRQPARMLIAKDRYAIAVMKAFGFTNSDIKVQYVARAVFVLVIGIILGTLLANTLGEALAGAAISSFGASTFAFVVNPVEAYLVAPLLMVGSLLVATMLGTLDAGKIKISENIKE